MPSTRAPARLTIASTRVLGGDGHQPIDDPDLGAEAGAGLHQVTRERDHTHAIAAQLRHQRAADESGGAGHEHGGGDERVGAGHAIFSSCGHTLPYEGRRGAAEATHGDRVAQAPGEQARRASREAPRRQPMRRPCEAGGRGGPTEQARAQRAEEHAVRERQQRVQNALERRQPAAAILLQEIGQRDTQLDDQQPAHQHRQRTVPLGPRQADEDDAVDRFAHGVQRQFVARRRMLRQSGVQFVVPEVVEAAKQRLHGQDGEDGVHRALPASATGSANTPD
jgi:hypothetical protein